MFSLNSFRFLFLLLFFWSCEPSGNSGYQKEASNPELLHDASKFLTQIVVYDIFKPPVASRIYAYTYLAAYEAMRFQDPKYPDLAGKLNQFKGVTAPKPGMTYCFPLVGMRAFFTVGKKITFSPEIWEGYEKTYFARFQKMNMPSEVFQRSMELGNQIAGDIVNYASTDKYATTRGVGYVLNRTPGSWEPTPPAYADACEPLWNTLRSFCLDSVSQFFPAQPTPYNENKDSKFYKMTHDVYSISKNLSKEQKDIAYFWDDNAFVSKVAGHFMVAEKKMTPPGHWVAIARTLSKKAKKDLLFSLEAYTLTSIAMYDAFMGSWEVKYRTSRIRPVTVIRKSINPNWLPFLETPPFPEYNSAHSAISAAAGTILVHLFGDPVSFIDSTEYEYGHGIRKFQSISEAYNQVSLSRVYGGIHFKEAVEQGTIQGKNTGEWVWKKLMISN